MSDATTKPVNQSLLSDYYDETQEPMETFGLGILSYFDSVKLFAKMFLLFTVINVPLIVVFMMHKTDAEGSLSLGNLG